MRSKKLFLSVFTLLFFTLLNNASTPGALTLDQCIAIALKNNHQYKSFQHEWQASRARVRQARAFPQPELYFDSDLQPTLFNYKQSGESHLGITQLIELPGRRNLRGKIASKESEITGCEVDLARQNIIYNVKRSFYQLLLAMTIQKYAEENLAMAKDFLAKAKEKYASGAVAKVEMLRAKVEAAKADNLLQTTCNQVKLAKAQLNFYLARNKFQPLNIQGNLQATPREFDIKKLQADALISRPELKQERLSVKKENLAKKQALFSYLPDVSLGISRHRIENEPSTWNVALSFEVPLFFWQKARGEIAETNANHAATHERLLHLELSVALEVENAYYNTISLKEQVALFEKEMLEEAEQVYQMSMTSYQEGKTSSIELIESRRSLVEIKQAYAETLFNYQLAQAELEKAVGVSIDNSHNPRPKKQKDSDNMEMTND